MEKIMLRVKGIIKRDDRYLVLKRWYDDRIPDPFMWEFVDGVVNFGEAPEEAVLRYIMEYLHIEGTIDHIEYTWSQMLGDTQCVGLAYICGVAEDADESIELAEEFGGYEWVTREEFENYIENTYVLNDLKGKKL